MKNTILKALEKATGTKEIQVEFPENEDFGDYSSNVAIATFENAKTQDPNAKWKTPREYAEEIVSKLLSDKASKSLFDNIEVAGAGFINFWLSEGALVSELERVIEKGDTYGSSDLGKNDMVLVEYSSPNIAKHFGIGHLRSTIIGQALYNLFKFLGYRVVGENHLGDWGTQFGAIIAQVQSSKLKVQSLTIDDLEKLYVEFNKKAQSDPELWDEARDWFKKLEEGDSKAREIWQEVKAISLKEFDRIYELLGVKIDNAHGESFYEDKMPSVIEEVREKGLSKKSEGAEIVEFKNLPPAMLVKSDGTTTYFTRDLAAAKYRIETWHPQILIYEVGSDQILHFRQVFQTVEMLGWKDDRGFVHVAHGLIRFQGGKMSTRAGQTVRLEEVLNQAIEKAKAIIAKSETSRGLSADQRDKVARAVGIGAVKYFDLSHHPTTDIIFDWEKMFVLEGSSGPYLQYTVARTNSVLAKSKTINNEQLTIDNLNAEELLLLRTLSRFPDIIVDAARNYSPNLICTYLFNLAQKYNNFYNQHRIIGGENEALRLRLTSACGQVLKNGLILLGIKAPERM